MHGGVVDVSDVRRTGTEVLTGGGLLPVEEGVEESPVCLPNWGKVSTFFWAQGICNSVRTSVRLSLLSRVDRECQGEGRNLGHTEGVVGRRCVKCKPILGLKGLSLRGVGERS